MQLRSIVHVGPDLLRDAREVGLRGEGDPDRTVRYWMSRDSSPSSQHP